MARIADRDADAGRSLQSRPAIRIGACSAGQDALRDLAGGLRHRGVLQQDRESSPDRRATTSGSRTQSPGACATSLQHLVAGQVAEAVVEQLEAVHVQVQQREAPLAVAAQPGDRALQAVAQVQAVGQSGQRVVHDLVLELRLDLLAHRDLLAQFAGACLHALLELGIEPLQGLGVLAALQAAGDLVGHEGQQFRIAAVVARSGAVALHRDHADHAVAAHQRHAQPAHATGAPMSLRPLRRRRPAARRAVAVGQQRACPWRMTYSLRPRPSGRALGRCSRMSTR